MLAGGRSTRFGRDKLAERYRGTPLLHRAVRRLAEVCPDVVVVLAPDAPEPSLPADVSTRFARDIAEGEGPLAGAHAGLMLAGTDLALAVGGDMPDLRVPVLREMLRVAAEMRADAVALQDGDRFRPLPCVVRVAPALETARAMLDRGDRRLRDLLDALRVSIVAEETWVPLDPERRTFLDVDEPSDLEG